MRPPRLFHTRAAAVRRRRAAFFVVPGVDEPPETLVDVSGRVWEHAGAWDAAGDAGRDGAGDA